MLVYLFQEKPIIILIDLDRIPINNTELHSLMPNPFLLFQLRKEQEIQKQMLWHSFQEKNKQLELQHQLQLEHKYQVSLKKKHRKENTKIDLTRL